MKFFQRKPDNFDYTQERTCLTCSHTFVGRYCSTCGERVVEPDDRSFKHFIGGVFNAFTFIDNKFLNSLKKLISNPGQLSFDIVRGMRQPYMKPIAFFFVGNFIYFLFPIFQTFNTSLFSQMTFMEYSNYATAQVNEHLTSTGKSIEDFSVIYNQVSLSWSKLLLILLVLLLFPFIVLINYSKKNYLSDHLMFSLEFCTYLIFVPTILLSFLIMFIVKVTSAFGLDLKFLFWDTYTWPALLILFLYFFIRSIRTFYQFKWWRVTLSTILLLFALQFCISVYRFILFITTMHELRG